MLHPPAAVIRVEAGGRPGNPNSDPNPNSKPKPKPNPDPNPHQAAAGQSRACTLHVTLVNQQGPQAVRCRSF